MANITTQKVSARQTVLAAHVALDFADFATADAADTLELLSVPGNAIITKVVLEVVTPFVAGAADDLTLSVEDTASSATTYIPASDLDSAALTVISDDVPVEYAAPCTLTATFGGTLTTFTAGKAFVLVEYMQVGRSNEVHE